MAKKTDETDDERKARLSGEMISAIELGNFPKAKRLDLERQGLAESEGETEPYRERTHSRPDNIIRWCADASGRTGTTVIDHIFIRVSDGKVLIGKGDGLRDYWSPEERSAVEGLPMVKAYRAAMAPPEGENVVAMKARKKS